MKKMQKTIIALLMISALLVFALSGCGDNDTGGGGDGPMRVALLLSGPANDQGFNQQAATGLQLAEEEFGIETVIMENVGAADMEPLFTDFAVQGFDLIMGHGFQFGAPAAAVSANFPDQYFASTNAASESPNMASFSLGNQEGAYLIGILHASMSESGIIGVVGGVEQPSIVREVEAFKLGARSVNPDITVLEIYIGSFTDVALGMEAALAMIDQGADVMYHVANQAGTGAITAAQDRGILASGNAFDQHSMAPDTIMLSNVYHIPAIVLHAVEAVRNGTFEGGVFYLGMADGIVELSPYHAFEDVIPQSVRDLIEETRLSILDGSFVVPIIETPTR